MAGCHVSPADEFDIDVTHVNGRVVVAVSGEIDLDTAPVLQTTLEALEATNHIVIDCANVEFIDSTGLAVLLRQSSRAKESGGALFLRRPSPPVERLVTFCCLEHLLESEV